MCFTYYFPCGQIAQTPLSQYVPAPQLAVQSVAQLHSPTTQKAYSQPQEFVFLSIDQKQERKRRFLISLLEIVVFYLVFGLWIEIQTPVSQLLISQNQRSSQATDNLKVNYMYLIPKKVLLDISSLG